MALAKQYGCSTFERMPEDEDLRVLWDDPRFKSFFVDAKPPSPKRTRTRPRRR